jgi:hypothetical protein
MLTRSIAGVLLTLMAGAPSDEEVHSISITGNCFPLERVLSDIQKRNMNVTPLLLAAEGDKIVLVEEKTSGSIMQLSPSTGLGCVVMYGPRSTRT